MYSEMFLKWSRTLTCITEHRLAALLKILKLYGGLFYFFWFCFGFFPWVCYFSCQYQALCSMEDFRDLDRDIEGSAKRWKKFVECESPEKENFPQEWKKKTSLQRLCMMRALRPDRMTYAIR